MDYVASKKGWYINLPASGERVVSDANIRAGRVVFNTLIPNSDPCGFGGTGWVMEVDVMTGNRNDSPTFDTNDDKQISAADLDLNGTHDNASGRAVASIPAAAGFLRAPTHARPTAVREQVRQHVGGFGDGHRRDRRTRWRGPRILAADTVKGPIMNRSFLVATLCMLAAPAHAMTATVSPTAAHGPNSYRHSDAKRIDR